MELLINRYSFVALGLLILTLATLTSGRLLGKKWASIMFSSTLSILIIFQVIASTKINTVNSLKDFDDALASGQPVLLELYSNF